MERIEDTLKVLNTIPARVGNLETQCLRLHQEMHDGFSAMRKETRDLRDDVMAQARVLHEDLVARIKVLKDR